MNFGLFDVLKISMTATIGVKIAELAWNKLVEPRLNK